MDKMESILAVVNPTVGRDFVIGRAKFVAKTSNAKVRFFINNHNTLSAHLTLYEGTDGEFIETQRRLYEVN
jgi:hypothetical protein